MTWNEDLHPRRSDGEFSRKGVGSWVEKVAKEWGEHFDQDTSLTESRDYDGHPAGHEAAKARLEHLWKVPDRKRGTERTDAEQAELEGLEDAFSAYRDELGLSPRDDDSGLRLYRDKEGNTYNEYGEWLADGPVTDEAPDALKRGYTRVGEHPTGAGKVGGEDSYITPSLHPLAGGLWIDPKRPGTRHAPSYRNDMGHGVSELRPKMQPSYARKDRLQGARRGEYRGRPRGTEGAWFYRQPVAEEGNRRGRYREGGFGYGARDEGGGQQAAVFVARMKRRQPRARQETGREAVRRTPRGTKIENWMQA